MAVGQQLPELVRTITLTDLVAYGSATWDWHRLHYDEAFARASGMQGPIVDGQMFGALLAEQVNRAVVLRSGSNDYIFEIDDRCWPVRPSPVRPR